MPSELRLGDRVLCWGYMHGVLERISSSGHTCHIRFDGYEEYEVSQFIPASAVEVTVSQELINAVRAEAR